jgi:hypothetical protein
MKTDIFLKRVPLSNTANLQTAVSQECTIQADRNDPRRLVAVFEAGGELILIFELFNQN